MYQDHEQAYRRIFYVILLALLIHLLIFYALLLLKTENLSLERPAPLTEQQVEQLLTKQEHEALTDEEKQQIAQWVEMKARYSQNQATVLVEDRPTDGEQIDKAHADNTPPPQPQQMAQPQTQPPVVEQVPKTMAQAEPEPRSQTPTLDDYGPSLAQQDTHEQAAPEQQKPATTTAEKNTQQEEQTDTPKPNLTLADIARGFNQNLESHGNNLVNMQGTKAGNPTGQQLNYERYLQKLNQCLANSWRIHNRNRPILSTQDKNKIMKGNVGIVFRLSIARDGSLQRLVLALSTDIPAIDEWLYTIFKDAATSFPPIPQSIPSDPLNFESGFSIVVGGYHESFNPSFKMSS